MFVQSIASRVFAFFCVKYMADRDASSQADVNDE